MITAMMIQHSLYLVAFWVVVAWVTILVIVGAAIMRWNTARLIERRLKEIEKYKAKVLLDARH